MVVVFDSYSDNVKKVQNTFQNMGIDIQIAVLEDNGFLPDDVYSVYEFFAYPQDGGLPQKEELFYNSLAVPEFWEIRTDGIKGAVYDMGCKKASIYFSNPIEKRNVRRVEWCMENGWIYRVDFYNKYGLKYASKFLDITGTVVSKVYYSGKNQEVIIEQPQFHTVSLHENGKMKAYFTDYGQFIEYYMQRAGFGDEATLFVQNGKILEIIGSELGMKKIWKRILFSDHGLLERYKSMGGKNGYRFCTIPENYPNNHAKGEVLILTASDQLEEIEHLTGELQDFTFHIAANTQVSDKIYKLAEQKNVKAYPQISQQNLKLLWDVCDFYLDINYFWEIYDAVDSAHWHNLLIMGFEDTLHRREFLADECIFAKGNCEKMILEMNRLIRQPVLVQELLIKQQRKKDVIWKRIFEADDKTEE